MKAQRLVLIFLLCIIGVNCKGQTDEQKKMIKEMEKKAAEAKRINDSLMNTPQMKKMMEQLKAQEAIYQKEREKQREEREAKKKEKPVNNSTDFYWINKIASDTQGQFTDWKWGAAELIVFNGDWGINEAGELIDQKYTVVGNISSNGKLTINLPATIETPYLISKALIPEMHSVTNRDVSFSRPEAAFMTLGFTLQVIGNNKHLGTLFIGNSERVTYNLAAPCCLFKGDEGYRLYWVYVEEACSAQLHKEFKEKKITQGEEEKLVDQTIIYDLDFQPGWNLIKSEVIGNYNIGGSTQFKTKKHTVVSTMPADARYYFKYND